MLKIKAAVRMLMMSGLLIGSGGAGAGCSSATASDAAASRVEADSQTLHQYIEASNRFGLELYRQVAMGDDSGDSGAAGNVFLSPFSINAAMDLVSQGAAGQTQQQMWRVMRLDALGDKPDALQLAQAYATLDAKLTPAADAGYQFTNANALWGLAEFTPKPQFLDAAKTYFAGGFERLDMPPDAAREHINQWVESKTNKLIKDLLPAGSLDEQTRLVLTNAIYFKGKWASPFNAEQTRDAPFTLADGGQVQVKMMRQRDARFKLLQAAGYKAIALPYAGDAMTMLAFLPDEGVTLATLEEQLFPAGLHDAIEKLGNQRQRKVRVELPRFRMTWQASLSRAMQALGMTLPFDPQQADFGGLADVEPGALFITGVFHKAYVEVNEQGTEAAAATGVAVAATSMPLDPPPTFIADRPFVFVIRQNDTGAILFVGRVMDPR